MRRLVLLASLGGCYEHGSSPEVVVPDVRDEFFACSSPTGAAKVTVLQTFLGSVYAGGVLFSGPVAPAKIAGTPFSLKFLFVKDQNLARERLFECTDPLGTCLLEGIAAFSTQPITGDTVIGSHAVQVKRTEDTQMIDGTIDVTSFTNPFDASPGAITGTISASGSAFSVSGSFSTVFCQPMLAVTI